MSSSSGFKTICAELLEIPSSKISSVSSSAPVPKPIALIVVPPPKALRDGNTDDKYEVLLGSPSEAKNTIFLPPLFNELK